MLLIRQWFGQVWKTTAIFSLYWIPCHLCIMLMMFSWRKLQRHHEIVCAWNSAVTSSFHCSSVGMSQSVSWDRQMIFPWSFSLSGLSVTQRENMATCANHSHQISHKVFVSFYVKCWLHWGVFHAVFKWRCKWMLYCVLIRPQTCSFVQMYFCCKNGFVMSFSQLYFGNKALVLLNISLLTGFNSVRGYIENRAGEDI